MPDVKDVAEEAVASADEWPMNSYLAILVAMTATAMAICSVKSGNIVQNMQIEQSAAVNSWSYFQSKSTKENIAESMVDTLRAYSLVATAEARGPIEERLRFYEGEVARYNVEKKEIKTKAEQHEQAFESLGVHDDQMDLTEAALSLAIAMYGLTALTRRVWLMWMGLGFSLLGGFFGLAAFLHWKLHPGWIMNLLT